MEYSKSSKPNYFRGGRKLEINSNILFHDKEFNKNSSLNSLHISSLDTKKANNKLDLTNDKNKSWKEENKKMIDIDKSISRLNPIIIIVEIL